MKELKDSKETKTIVKSQIVYEGLVWDIQRDEVEIQNANFQRDYISHTSAVAVLAFDETGKIILIKQYRHPVREKLWEIPAGLLDLKGEAQIEAAKRELKEETDYEAAQISKLISYYPTPGSSNEELHIFLATGCRKVDSEYLKEAEEAELEVATFDLEEVKKAVLNGEIKNGPLVTAVLAYEAGLSLKS